jgi:hypothetical protein
MTPASPLLRRFTHPRLLLAFTVALAIVITAGCGSSHSSPPALTGNTEVTVMVSGTANDELQQFDIAFTSLTLTSQSGTTVNLLSTQVAQGAEFIHINGGAEPLLTVSVPQGIYTAAAATNLGYDFVCVTQVPGTLATATFGDPYGGPNATINLPTPITITGDSMALSLDMLVSQSATISSCYVPNGYPTWTISPTFNLTPLTLSPQPTNAENGKVTGVHGEIASINAASNSFTLSLTNMDGPRTFSASANSATVYQGISNFSALTVGTFVDMDGAVQSNGSLLAMRVAVEDASAVNVVTGPLTQVISSNSFMLMVPREEEGASFLTQAVFGGAPFTFGSAVFQISGQLTNLQTLPFTASFNGSNMVDGQNVYVSAPLIPDAHPEVAARTITLIPQTIDGTIAATSNTGGFAIYTVTLAPYDLFPILAAQPGQTTLLTNPSQVEVYVDNNTQMLNSGALAVGNTLRFNGLVFNDNGTLRMDCAQINDGVAPQPAAQAAAAVPSSNSTQHGVVHQYLQHTGVSR